MKILLALFIMFMFFPIPFKFYIYYYNNDYYIKLYNFILLNNNILKKKKEQKEQTINNPPIKQKKKIKPFKSLEIITFSDIKIIINKFITLKFKPFLNLSSKLEYSLNDAAKTALSYGILSELPSITYFIIKVLFKPKKYNFKISPKFNDTILLKFEIKSIIFISFANIIYMTFVLLKYYIYVIYKIRKTKSKNIHKEWLFLCQMNNQLKI